MARRDFRRSGYYSPWMLRGPLVVGSLLCGASVLNAGGASGATDAERGVNFPIDNQLDPTDAKRMTIDRLFDAAWNPSRNSGAALDAIYRQASPSRQIDDAYLLALMKQRRYDDALSWLEVDRGVASDDVLRGRTHVWLFAATRDDEAAIPRLADLLETLPPRPLAEWTPAERGVLDFASRLIGYWRGPRESLAATQLVDRYLTPAIKRLGEEAIERVEQMSTTVLAAYQVERDAIDQLREEAKRAEEKEKKEERDRLQEQAADIEKRQQAIADERSQLRDELRQQLADLIGARFRSCNTH